jgi:hypothetical protein
MITEFNVILIRLHLQSRAQVGTDSDYEHKNQILHICDPQQSCHHEQET